MGTDSTAPVGMVEWSRTAATLLRAVARAYPGDAPADVGARADELWKLARRGATLTGVIETLTTRCERLAEAGSELRAEIERRIESLARGESEDASGHTEKLRQDLERYEDALEQDLRTARGRVESHVREARACEAAFTATCTALVEHLRDEPACRELLRDI